MYAGNGMDMYAGNVQMAKMQIMAGGMGMGMGENAPSPCNSTLPQLRRTHFQAPLYHRSGAKIG